MLDKKYTELALRTENVSLDKIRQNLASPGVAETLIASLKSAVEMGKSQDLLKKKVIYSKDVTIPLAGDASKDLNLTDKDVRIVHAVIGILTEATEIQEALLKKLEGGALDEVNLVEEVGDLFWYCAVLCDAAGGSFEEAKEKNINKLAARYGDKYSDVKALERNLNIERKILEK